MALILADRVKVRAFTTGTGTFTLSDTVTGFRGFSAIGDGNDTFYGIIDSNNNWEIGRGTWSQITNTLTRTVVLSSSNSGSLVDFPVGAKTVYSTFPASAASDFTYTTSVETASGGATIRLTRSGGEDDDIAILGTSGIIVTRTDASTITLSSDITVTQSVETTSGGAILRLDQSGVADDVSIIGDDGLVVTRTDANTITLTTDITQSMETTGFVGTSIYDDFESGTLDPLLWSQVQNVAIVTNGTGTGTSGGFRDSGSGIYLVSGNIYDATSLGAVSSIDQLAGQPGYTDLPDFGYIKYTIAKSTGNQTIDVAYRRSGNILSQSAFSLLGSALTYGANTTQSILNYPNDDHDTLFLDANGNGVLARINTDVWSGNFDSFKETSVVTSNSSLNSVVAYGNTTAGRRQFFVSFPKTISGVWFNLDLGTYQVNNLPAVNFSLELLTGQTPRNNIFTISDGVNQFILGRWGQTSYFRCTVDLTTGTIDFTTFNGPSSFQSNASEEDSNGTQLFAVDGTVTFHSGGIFYYGGTRPWKDFSDSFVSTSGKSSFTAGVNASQTDMDIFGSIGADGYVWFADWGHDNGGLFNVGNDSLLGTRKTNIRLLDDSFASSTATLPSTRYLLFGNNGDGTRLLTTTVLDLSGITTISLRYITGNSNNGGEQVDSGENLLLQLSLDGSNFDTVVTLPLSSIWTSYTYTVDSQFRSSNVYVRFSQVNSGSTFDWIGLDTIQLTGNTALNSVIHRLSRSGAANDDITIQGRSGIEITRNSASRITLTAGISQSVETVAGGAIIRMTKTQGSEDDITITGTTGVAVSRVDADTINIDTTEATGLSIVMGL